MAVAERSGVMEGRAAVVALAIIIIIGSSEQMLVVE